MFVFADSGLIVGLSCVLVVGRPIINNKFEEKTCGDGPSLATMFEDDKHLQTVIHNIRVSPTILLADFIFKPSFCFTL